MPDSSLVVEHWSSTACGLRMHQVSVIVTYVPGKFEDKSNLRATEGLHLLPQMPCAGTFRWLVGCRRCACACRHRCVICGEAGHGAVNCQKRMYIPLENPKNLLKDRQIQEQGGRQQPMCSLLRKIRGQRKKKAHTYWDLETFILKLCVAELYIRGSNWVGEEDLRLDSYVSISKTRRSGYQVFSKVLKSSFNVRISCVNFQQIHKKMWLSSRTKLRQ